MDFAFYHILSRFTNYLISLPHTYKPLCFKSLFGRENVNTTLLISLLLSLIMLIFLISRKISSNNYGREKIFLDAKLISLSPEISSNLNSHGTGQYEGDKVFLRKIQDKLLPLKESSWNLFGQMIEMRDYNLVTFKGLLNYQPSPQSQISSYFVWENCERGSLYNIIRTEQLIFDWPFELSLLFDLSNGLKYLHHSSIGKHGWLTSRDCVVDNKWLLKITNFGLLPLYEMHGYSEFRSDYTDYLWSPPEVIKASIFPASPSDSRTPTELPPLSSSPVSPSSSVVLSPSSLSTALSSSSLSSSSFSSSSYSSSRLSDENKAIYGSKESDIYGFGIIMSELTARSPPFGCYDESSAEKIITQIRLKHFVRPSLSSIVDVPSDMLQLIRRCWSENPENRPKIDEIHEKLQQKSDGKVITDSMLQKLERYTSNLEALVAARTLKLEEEKKKTELLLHRMLPPPVANKLKKGEMIEPDKFEEVTIYFSDIVGFTTISAYSRPIEIISLLNDVYTRFDSVIHSYEVYKVETIGDAYMVVSGVPERRSDHAEQIATMALDILHSCGQIKIKHLPNVPLKIRIGINTGPVVAGVVGTAMPRYCLFGNTVNIASRMESTGRAYRIHISSRTEKHLKSAGGYHTKYRGEIDLKGRGKKATYWLVGKDGFNKPLPKPENDEGENHGFNDCEIMEIFGDNRDSSDVSPSSPTSSSALAESIQFINQTLETRNNLEVPK